MERPPRRAAPSKASPFFACKGQRLAEGSRSDKRGGHPMIEPTRIIAIRHGETAWTADTRIQGHIDIPLSDVGRRQIGRAHV